MPQPQRAVAAFDHHPVPGPGAGDGDATLAVPVADQRVEKVQTCQCLMQKVLAAGADADKNRCR